jgi:hypothetical protein
MVQYTQKEINYMVKQSKETIKWREYLTMVNKPSRVKRQLDLTRQEKIEIKKFWNDIYDDSKINAPKCSRKKPLIGQKYQINPYSFPKPIDKKNKCVNNM